MNRAMRRRVEDPEGKEDVFVIRIGPAIWNVCRWNTDRGTQTASSIITKKPRSSTPANGPAWETVTRGSFELTAAWYR